MLQCMSPLLALSGHGLNVSRCLLTTQSRYERAVSRCCEEQLFARSCAKPLVVGFSSRGRKRMRQREWLRKFGLFWGVFLVILVVFFWTENDVSPSFQSCISQTPGEQNTK